MPTKDNNSSLNGSFPSEPDSYGYAALLLVESLIHELCANGTLSAAEAIEVVDRAASVQYDQAEAADGKGAPLWRSHALLLTIAASLRADGTSGPTLRPLP